MSIRYTSKHTNRMAYLCTKTATIQELRHLLARKDIWISQRDEINAKDLLARKLLQDN